MSPSERSVAGAAIRAFIALDLYPAIKQAIAAYLLPLRQLADGVSWVKTWNLHFTLKFLGDTRPAQIPELAAVFGEICGRYEPFRGRISGSGVFPNERKPNVLWLGLETETGKLNKLAREIDSACTGFGFKAENRPFAPHLTIGRVRNGEIGALIKTMRDSPFSSQETILNECILMKSELQPGGAIYRPLHNFPFARETG
jgi:2'-5' RNA ligase